ncbi:GSCOCG00000053001-RA-CDS [Cotesia congregata]|nr:GSCOCG00000053001-RA-CDS [Cotesia congregata]
MKRQAELEVTKTELAELQRKVENEIISLKNRYKKSQINNQDDDSKFAATPRLVKIEVDTYEIDNPRQLEHHSQNIKKREDNSNDKINIKISEGNDKNKRSVKRRMITYNEKGLVKTSQEDIDKKIEALKKIVREQIDLDKRSEEIENSNLKSNEIKNIFTNTCPLSNDVDKKVKKRSASLERKNKSKKPVVKKRKKSVSKNISIRSNAVDSNLITSKSKFQLKIIDT